MQVLLKSGNAKMKIVWAVALLLMCLAPLISTEFRLSLLAKFLALAILAIGLDLIWGYGGVLSLGHGVFFGLGGYAMAMHLKLQASGTSLPDFMGWSGLRELPWFWEPFRSFPAAVALGILLPALLAFVLGWFTFRNRISGVYFTILTQALVLITVTLFVGKQEWTGGTNGITGFYSIFGFALHSWERRSCCIMSRLRCWCWPTCFAGAWSTAVLAKCWRRRGTERTGCVFGIRSRGLQDIILCVVRGTGRHRRNAVCASGRHYLAFHDGHCSFH